MIKVGDDVEIIDGHMAGTKGKVTSAYANGYQVEAITDSGLAYTLFVSSKEVKKIDPTPQTLPTGSTPAWWNTDYPSEEERQLRKENGCCLKCGDLLPMSVWGLGDCPKHPKAMPEKQ
jgi:hypothetical protein